MGTGVFLAIPALLTSVLPSPQCNLPCCTQGCSWLGRTRSRRWAGAAPPLPCSLGACSNHTQQQLLPAGPQPGVWLMQEQITLVQRLFAEALFHVIAAQSLCSVAPALGTRAP